MKVALKCVSLVKATYVTFKALYPIAFFYKPN